MDEHPGRRHQGFPPVATPRSARFRQEGHRPAAPAVQLPFQRPRVAPVAVTHEHGRLERQSVPGDQHAIDDVLVASPRRGRSRVRVRRRSRPADATARRERRQARRGFRPASASAVCSALGWPRAEDMPLESLSEAAAQLEELLRLRLELGRHDGPSADPDVRVQREHRRDGAQPPGRRQPVVVGPDARISPRASRSAQFRAQSSSPPAPRRRTGHRGTERRARRVRSFGGSLSTTRISCGGGSACAKSASRQRSSSSGRSRVQTATVTIGKRVASTIGSGRAGASPSCRRTSSSSRSGETSPAAAKAICPTGSSPRHTRARTCS